MKVCFETFGCRLNKAEALQMEAEYLAKGWELTKDHAKADLFIVRGCSVTARAQRECENLVDRLKRHHPLIPVRLCGCIEDKNTPVEPGRTAVTSSGDSKYPLPTRTARAYLKVQDGCSGQCTFCIVPKFRGESKSVDFEETLDRAKRFIDAGYHEIVVTGCNLALYCSHGKRLQDLTAALAGLSPDCRIRLGSVEPGPCALETVHAMSEHGNVCRFLHLPIQSGSDLILTAMRRPYKVKDVKNVANLAAGLMPGLGLGCDLMTGFPDESEVDLGKTKALLRELPFNNAHVFPFSKRPGTAAIALPRQVAHQARSHRAHELANIIKASRRKYARTFIGKTVEIVVEDEKKGKGWTGEYLPCEVIGHVLRKSLARVFVTRVEGDQLYGRLK